MDKEESSDYAELLKQLEELKRKRAHKERILMKLKNSSPKIFRESLNNSPSTSNAKSYSAAVNEISKEEVKSDQNYFKKDHTFSNSHLTSKGLSLKGVNNSSTKISSKDKSLNDSPSTSSVKPHSTTVNEFSEDIKKASQDDVKKDHTFNKSHLTSKIFSLKAIKNSSPKIAFRDKSLNDSPSTSSVKPYSTAIYEISKDAKKTSKNDVKKDHTLSSSCITSKKLSLQAVKNSKIGINCENGVALNSENKSKTIFCIEEKTDKSNKIVFVSANNTCSVDSQSVIKHSESQSNKSISFKVENAHSVTPQNKIFEHSKAVSASQPLNKNQCPNLVFDEEQPDSNKSPELPNRENKNSDKLDYSLDGNISCFLHSSVFDECNSNEEIIGSSQNKVHDSSKKIESTKYREDMTELINSDIKISPSFPMNSSSNESQKINFDAFNFPKFSTPSDMNISCSNNMKSPNNFRNTSSAKGPIKKVRASGLFRSVIKANNDISVSEIVEKVDKNKITNNVFDSSHFNPILNTGLSFVLDAHYDSPIKKQHVLKCETSCNMYNKKESYFFQDASKDISKKRNLEFLDENKPKSKHFEKSTINLKSSPQWDFNNEADMKYNKVIDDDDFDFDILLNSNPFTDSPTKISDIKTSPLINCDKIHIQSQSLDGLISKSSKKEALELKKIIETSPNCNAYNENITCHSEILIVPETPGLFSKGTGDFLETSTLSQSFRHFNANENLLDTSSQSRLTSPIVNNIVSALKSCDHSDKVSKQKANQLKGKPFITSKRLQLKPLCKDSLHDAYTVNVSSKIYSGNEFIDDVSWNKKENQYKDDPFLILPQKKEAEIKPLNTETCHKSLISDTVFVVHSENKYEDNAMCHQKENGFRDESFLIRQCVSGIENKPLDTISFHDTLAMDTSFLEDDTQDLGKLKQVPHMDTETVQESHTTVDCKTKDKSSLNFICSLHGAENEPVMDAEIILFNNVKYAFLQHRTQIHVWRQEEEKWVKIYYHLIEDKLFLDKICISRDPDNLAIVMLLVNDQKYCLQFLLFEKDAKAIKFMENTHWLEERHSEDLILLCGLDNLMFATAQCKDSHEVSVHAFTGLKETPQLMSAVLGSTDDTLCNLCKIDKLPNALMGINDSMLYIWHIMEARLVTAVTLHPHDYLPIKNCFWATVENGLIYFMTTCEGANDFRVCQLIAANLATGLCQSAMTYTTLPSEIPNKAIKITKASYLEPFLVVAHSHGAYLWSVTEQFCCAALHRSQVTTVAISKDSVNWGILAVGNNVGCIHCYSLN